MKKIVTAKIQLLAAGLLLLIAPAARAQTAGRVFNFITGDTYVKQTAIITTSALQRGDFKYNISSSSQVAKSYQVTSAGNNGYSFTVVTKKITDTMNSAGKQMIFNSDGAIDNSSQLANDLNFMVGKPLSVSIDKDGVISKSGTYAPKLGNDTLFQFSGVEPEDFTVGSQFGLITKLTAHLPLLKNFSWADTSITNAGQTTTKFWIQKYTDRSTTVGFSSSTKGESMNTSTNGVYVINNKSGVITQRVLQSVSTGYTIYNRVVYASSRRTSISESCYKTN